MIFLLPLHGDFWIADRLYAAQGHAWQLRNDWVTEVLVHKLGKHLSSLAWLATAGLFISSHWVDSLRRWRWPALYILATVALSTGAVSILKHLTDMDCPWDLQRYGGQLPFVDLFSARPLAIPKGQCFPAGHASAGYAWVALYFFLLDAKPGWRMRGLATGLAAGLVFGVSQQLRGAHFMSHDIATLAICWWGAMAGYVLLRRRLQHHNNRPARDAAPGSALAVDRTRYV